MREFFEEPHRAIESRLLFYLAALWDSWHAIEELRREGPIVLDRYTLSTQVYHEVLLGKDLSGLFRLAAPPDGEITIVLDVSPAVAQSRLGLDGSVRFDCTLEQNIDLQVRIASRFRSRANIIIDTTDLGINEVVDKCMDVWMQLFDRDADA